MKSEAVILAERAQLSAAARPLYIEMICAMCEHELDSPTVQGFAVPLGQLIAEHAADVCRSRGLVAGSQAFRDAHASEASTLWGKGLKAAAATGTGIPLPPVILEELQRAGDRIASQCADALKAGAK